MDETRRRYGCDHSLACALVLRAVRGIGEVGRGPSLAVLGWLAVAALATMGAAGESPPSRAGVEVVLQFGEQEGQSQSDRTEQPTFRPGAPIPLVVRVQNKSAAAWSAEALSLTRTLRVTHLGTGQVLHSPALYWRVPPRGAAGRVEPGRTASFPVDLQALYPYDSGRPDVRSVWRPGKYSVRVVTVLPRPGYGWYVARDDASHEPVESAVLHFRVVARTENDPPSRAGVEVVLQFGEQGGQSQSGRTEQPTFRPGAPIPLLVRVQNKRVAAWSTEPLCQRRTFEVTHLGTGQVLHSPGLYWRAPPGRGKGRVEPGRTASLHVDLQALYPYDEGGPDLRSVWRPGEYSVRVVIVLPRPAYGRYVPRDDESREPVESAALRFRVVGPTENDLPRYLRAASVGLLEDRLKTIKVLGAARLRSASAKLTALALCDPSDAVRFEALCALGRIGKVGPARALERIALTDASSKVRGVAASMPGDWGEKRSIRVLKKLSRKDPHDRVRKAAERAIERIKNTPAGGPHTHAR